MNKLIQEVNADFHYNAGELQINESLTRPLIITQSDPLICVMNETFDNALTKLLGGDYTAPVPETRKCKGCAQDFLFCYGDSVFQDYFYSGLSTTQVLV